MLGKINAMTWGIVSPLRVRPHPLQSTSTYMMTLNAHILFSALLLHEEVDLPAKRKGELEE